MDTPRHISLEYLATIETINNSHKRLKSLGLTRALKSDYIASLLNEVKYINQKFWFDKFSSGGLFQTNQGLPSLMLWGVPFRTRESKFSWDPEWAIFKLLCFSPHVVVPDWIGDGLQYLNHVTERYWQNHLIELLNVMEGMLSLRPFVKSGNLSIFPNFNVCRFNWQIEYKSIIDEVMTPYYEKIESGKQIELSHIERYHAQMAKEAFLIQSKVGHIPATFEENLFEQGKFELKRNVGSGEIIEIEEVFPYVKGLSPELLNEIRRWDNQTIFFECLSELADQYDCSDSSKENLEAISEFILKKKYLKSGKESKKNLFRQIGDLILGVASMVLPFIGLLSVLSGAERIIHGRKGLDQIPNLNLNKIGKSKAIVKV